MKRLLLLASVTLIVSAVSFASSINYASQGSLGAHTATLKGNLRVGSSLTLSSPLIDINSISATGTVTLTTGSLVATSSPNVLAFTGGSITVTSGGDTLFHSSFSSGTVTLLGASNFRINGTLSDGTGFTTETDTNGDVQGNTAVVAAEPGTLGLIATGIGLLGLAAIARRKKCRPPLRAPISL